MISEGSCDRELE